MNKFDQRYYFKLGKNTDIDRIMSFLRDNWNEGHILANDREFFEYQYLNNKSINFVLAIEKNSNTIQGVYGFIKSSYTDGKTDIWGSIWKVKQNEYNDMFLGVELINRLKDFVDYRYRLGIGANPKTSILFNTSIFKRKTDKMQHYYMLNNGIENYGIASIVEKSQDYGCSNKKYKVIHFDCFDDLIARFDIDSIQQIPFKDKKYMKRRYYEHPYFKYHVYGIFKKDEKIEALFVTREISQNDCKVLRIVDYLGNQELFSGIGYILKTLLIKNNYEYIDMYTLGFDERYLNESGFKKRTSEDNNIIPNYFEPFIQENVDIWVHYDVDNVMFFKADGDQDRPNKKNKYVLRGTSNLNEN